MPGDFSRNTFDKKKHFSNVRMQQGRVQTDADWNEQMDILDYRRQLETIDFIGESGVPTSTKGGFDININDKKNNLTISTGHYYINGLLVENEQHSNGKNPLFTTQTDFPKAALPTINGLYLAYLDVWQRDITAADNTALLEPALNGIDTTTRLKNIGQVKLLPLPNQKFTGTNLTCQIVVDNDTKNKDAWQKAIASSTGKLNVNVSTNANLKNQLYRIEIHQQGNEKTAKFKWSRDNASIAASIDNIEDSNTLKTQKVITIKSINDNSIDFKTGRWLELTNDTGTLKGQAGIFVQLKIIKDHQLTVIQWPNDAKPEDFKNGVLRQWDTNATTLNQNNTDFTKIKIPTRNTTTKVITITLDKEAEWPTGLIVGQSIELTSQARIDKQQKSYLAAIISIPSKTNNVLTVSDSDGITASELKTLNRLRIFASGILATQQSTFVALENGLEVKFDKGTYNVGDYWLIATRSATNTVLNWPKTSNSDKEFIAKLPEGIKHYYAKLALVKKENTVWSKIYDCRNTFTPLTNKAFQAEPGKNNKSVLVKENGAVNITKGDLSVEKNLNVTGKTRSNTLQVDGAAELKKGVTVTGETKTTSLITTGKTKTGALEVIGNMTNDVIITSKAWEQRQKLQADNAAAWDTFGRSVAINGQWAIIGAPARDSAQELLGSAYIFQWKDNKWQQYKELGANNVTRGDWFGQSVDISGDWAIVGAPLKDTNNKSNAGGAYLFQRTGVTWEQRQIIYPKDAAAKDEFGLSVAISGNWVIVGAPKKSLTSESKAGSTDMSEVGSAYIFYWNGKKWEEQQKLQADNAATTDRFGWSVAIDSQWAIVGAPFKDLEGKSDSGSAYVSQLKNNKWQPLVKLQVNDVTAGDWFGTSVAINGQWAIIGAPARDPTHKSKIGSAYIFQWKNNKWQQYKKLLPNDVTADDYFGQSVDIKGNWAIVGAPEKHSGSTRDVGNAYIFQWKNSTWQQYAKLRNYDAAPGDNFGWSAAIGSLWIIVGAINEDAKGLRNAGSAYLWVLQNNIGIGTSSPKSKLEVIGNNSTPTIVAKNDGTGYALYAPKGKIYAVSGVGAFTGVHEAIIASPVLKNIKPGMLLSMTGTLQTRTLASGSKELSSTLPTVDLSNVANDSKVIGVFSAIDTPLDDYWYQPKITETLISFNALGDGLALVSNINGDIKVGDYITTSQIPGYGMKQSDNILYSHTLGKAMQDVNWKNITDIINVNGKSYKTYLMGIIYTSG